MKKNLFKIFNVFVLLLSLYLLYITFGILINSSVSITYETASLEDIKYVHSYSKLFILYIILVLIYSFVVCIKNKKS
jgi:hypothetical protein